MRTSPPPSIDLPKLMMNSLQKEIKGVVCQVRRHIRNHKTQTEETASSLKSPSMGGEVGTQDILPELACLAQDIPRHVHESERGLL